MSYVAAAAAEFDEGTIFGTIFFLFGSRGASETVFGSDFFDFLMTNFFVKTFSRDYFVLPRDDLPLPQGSI